MVQGSFLLQSTVILLLKQLTTVIEVYNDYIQ